MEFVKFLLFKDSFFWHLVGNVHEWKHHVFLLERLSKDISYFPSGIFVKYPDGVSFLKDNLKVCMEFKFRDRSFFNDLNSFGRYIHFKKSLSIKEGVVFLDFNGHLTKDLEVPKDLFNLSDVSIEEIIKNHKPSDVSVCFSEDLNKDIEELPIKDLKESLARNEETFLEMVDDNARNKLLKALSEKKRLIEASDLGRETFTYLNDLNNPQLKKLVSKGVEEAVVQNRISLEVKKGFLDIYNKIN